ncbi:MAG: hypothetical protein RIG61_08310 [Deltaproteobacteria bacterium]
MSVPPLSKKEEGSFVTFYKEGGKRWEAKWEMEEFEENGVRMIRITMNAEGLTSPFTRDMKWESVSVWRADGSFTPLKAETEIRDMEGNPVMTEEKTIDTQNGTATFTRKDYEGDGSLEKQFGVSPDLLIVEGLVVALRSLPFKSGGTIKTQFLTNEPELYNVEFKQSGIEKVKTHEGEIECFKVELVPKLGILNAFKVFFPKTYFWFTIAPPHRWVKYQGFENGRDTPEVVMEVKSFKEIGR